MRLVMKRRFLSFVCRCVACVAVFLILSALKKALPEIYAFAEKALERSVDIKKICSLLHKAVQEIS